MDILYTYKEAIVIVILVVTIIYLIVLYYSLHDSMVSGMWQASEDFCIKSGVDNMLLRISDKNEYGHTACLIITENNHIVLDETFDIQLGYILPKKIISTTVTLDRDIEFMPVDMQCIIDMTNGVMVWKDDEVEYGRFQRMYI